MTSSGVTIKTGNVPTPPLVENEELIEVVDNFDRSRIGLRNASLK